MATIVSKASLLASLDSKMERLVGEMTTDEADLKAATEICTKEASDFAALEKELTEVIDILNHAIGLLERNASVQEMKNASKRCSSFHTQLS